MTDSERLAFEAKRLRFPSGEHFWTVMKTDGSLPRIAMQFALEQRDRGSAARLGKLMRRIAALYSWYAKYQGLDFEEMIRQGRRPGVQHLRRALSDFKARKFFADGNRNMGSHASARSANDCISAWLGFLGFAVLRDNWVSGVHEPEIESHRSSRQAYIADVTAVMNEAREPEAPSDSHVPFSSRELAAIEGAIRNTSTSAFAPNCRRRNELIYRLLRSSGIRISELLQLKHTDLPPAETRSERALRQMRKGPQTLKIERRPDDPSDPRTQPALAKRGDRSVELPERLMEDLLEYSRKTRIVASPYVFRGATKPEMPLSYSRMAGIARQIRAAVRRQPEMREVRFTWHRLRATRAVEAVQEFFPDGIRTEERTRGFLAYFGWANPESAEPYLKTLVYARKQTSFDRQMSREGSR